MSTLATYKMIPRQKYEHMLDIYYRNEVLKRGEEGSSESKQKMLLLALQCGYMEKVERLYKDGAEPKEDHVYALALPVESLKWLLEKLGTVDLNRTDVEYYEGRTVLPGYVEAGSREAVELLLDNGADPLRFGNQESDPTLELGRYLLLYDVALHNESYSFCELERVQTELALKLNLLACHRGGGVEKHQSNSDVKTLNRELDRLEKSAATYKAIAEALKAKMDPSKAVTLLEAEVKAFEEAEDDSIPYAMTKEEKKEAAVKRIESVLRSCADLWTDAELKQLAAIRMELKTKYAADSELTGLFGTYKVVAATDADKATAGAGAGGEAAKSGSSTADGAGAGSPSVDPVAVTAAADAGPVAAGAGDVPAPTEVGPGVGGNIASLFPSKVGQPDQAVSRTFARPKRAGRGPRRLITKTPSPGK